MDANGAAYVGRVGGLARWVFFIWSRQLYTDSAARHVGYVSMCIASSDGMPAIPRLRRS